MSVRQNFINETNRKKDEVYECRDKMSGFVEELESCFKGSEKYDEVKEMIEEINNEFKQMIDECSNYESVYKSEESYL